MSKAGFWTAAIRLAMSRPVPLRHASSKIVDSSTWSRLLIGFASRSSSARSPDTTVAMRSRNAAVSCSNSAAGAANERTTDSGSPDSEPGV